MKKILFPTDFSETANNALVFALNIAKKNNAVLDVFHVYKKPIITGRIPAKSVIDYNLNSELKSFEEFKEKSVIMHKIADDNNLADVDMKLILEEGYFPDTLNVFIDKEKDIDLIVMGTNGASSYMEKAFFGSNTVHTIESLNMPVLSVPVKAKFTSINSIAFTTLFKEKDKAALKELIKLALKFNAEIHCVHVSKNKNSAVALEEWEKEFAGEPVNFKILELSESVNKTILNYVKEQKIDLIAAVSRNLNFFEELFSPSFTKKISYESDIPIYVFK